jgi:anti-sigma regulatory factor (Ser/Thr protein kinase)
MISSMSGAVTFPVRGPRHLTLPFAPESVRLARHELDRWLDGWSPREGFADDCRLVVSELVGHAVRHAHPLDDGTMAVDWECADDAFCIRVSDGGSGTFPHLVDARRTDVGGRGMVIIDALVTDWWVETGDARTTVHALLPVAV